MSAVLFAKTFAPSTERFSASDRGHVLDFLFKLQTNPAQPGLRMERVQRTRDRHLWAARVTDDIRAIIHRESDTFTVLYAGQHEDAYDWAEKRTVARHAVTGALQIVESTEAVEEAIAAQPAAEGPALFAAYEDDYLLSLGVPPEWLPTLRRLTSLDVLLEAVGRLPEEAAEALWDLAHGLPVTPPARTPRDRSALENPDTGRRFFLLERDDDLQRMLEAPLATWVVFLHPSQRRLATGRFNGPLKVTGAAGTGKTVVAMHRARHLASQGRRVLLTSFVTTLCKNIEQNLKLLGSADELARITVVNVHSQATELLKQAGEPVKPVLTQDLQRLLEELRTATGCPFSMAELRAEWEAVIQAHGLTSWEAYRGVSRVGRGRPLAVRERQAMWAVFERLYERYRARGMMDYPNICRRARELLASGTVASPFDAVVVDEVQDLGPQELRLLAALAGEGPDRLTLVGDAGQRIYERPLSLRALGIDVRGRSHVLRINYRTTEQIRRFADRLLGDRVGDLDEGTEERRGTRSLLRGPAPTARGFSSGPEQMAFVAEQIRRCLADGLAADEIAVFARTNPRADRARQALTAAGIAARSLADAQPSAGPAVSVGTMHRAKGLEFKVVFVVDASDDVVPLPMAVESQGDPADREITLAGERQLLYVSLTRARDEAFVTWVGEASRFLADALAVTAG